VPEVEDRALLDMRPRSWTSSCAVSREWAHGAAAGDEPFARGIWLRKITRNLVEIPVAAGMEILRGDVLTLVAASVTSRGGQAIGHADRPVESTDLAVVAAAS